MFFYKNNLNKCYLLNTPDYSECRNNKYLLIWKDLPHWMIVDEEMYTFLNAFSGSKQLHDVLESQKIKRAEHKTIIRTLKSLQERGVVREIPNGKEHISAIQSLYNIVPIQNIALNLTRKCNLRCEYCYNLDRLICDSSKELTAHEITQFLFSIKPLLSRRASLTILGGEPMLYPEKLLAVAAHAKRLGIKPLVSTNGTLIDQAFAKQAKQLELEVQISLDAHTPALCDRLRGPGVFEKVRAGTEILKQHKVFTILSMVCYKQNLPYLGEYLKLAADWQVDEARFIPLKILGGAKTNVLRPASHLDIIRQAISMLNKQPEYGRLLKRDCLTILADTCRFSNKRFSCGTGLQTFLLDSDGTVYPCLNMNMPEFALGNIRDDSFDFKTVWKHSKVLNPLRRAVSIENPSRVCHSCIVKHWCLGGCRGEAYALTGQLEGPSNHCSDLRNTLIEIFWLLEQKADIISTGIR